MSNKEVCNNLRSTISNSSLVFPDIGIGEDRSLKVVVQHGCHEYDDSDGGDDGDDGDGGDVGDDGEVETLGSMSQSRGHRAKETKMQTQFPDNDKTWLKL